jgi:hypothetical protein
MFNKIFLDANILVDFIDNARDGHKVAKKLVINTLEKNMKLFTSCDIVTTVYYLSAKKDKKLALNQIININRFCTIIEFSNKEVNQACELMMQETKFTDLEDTLQYVLAQKAKCEAIISNDKNFFSPKIELFTSEQFCQKQGIVP